MAKIVIFGRDNCKFCSDAKHLCEMNGFKYEYKYTTDPEVKDELLYLVPTARTVPQIFVNDKYIGGYDAFKIYVQENMKDFGNLN